MNPNNPHEQIPGMPANPQEIALMEQQSRQLAIEQMAEVEHQAIRDINPHEAGDPLGAAQEVQKNRFVASARKDVEAAYGQAAAVEATEVALDESNLNTKNVHELAEATVLDGADNNVGRSTSGIAGRAKEVIKKVGIGGKKQAELQAEVTESHGAEITSDEAAVHARRELVGESVVEVMAGKKPFASEATQKDVLEMIKDDPKALVELGNAVRHYRATGGQDIKAFDSVGKSLENQINKAA